jgi:polyhydroxybutyrate depolymerase
VAGDPRLALFVALAAGCADTSSTGATVDTSSGDATDNGSFADTRTDESTSLPAVDSTTTSTTHAESSSDGSSTTALVDCPGLAGDPGLNPRSITVGAADRAFLLYIPAALDPERAVPLVLVHHGASMSGDSMRTVTGFTDLADEEGFIVAFPESTNPSAPWNVGQGVCPPGNLANGTADDFAFVDAMIDAIEAVHCVDPERVFVTGFSMGGYFSNHVGCAYSERVRAVAPHSSGTYTTGCTDAPIPVLLLHGTADPLIGLQCGVQARDAWVERNGCSTEFDIVPLRGGGCQRHRDCPAGAQVTLCNFAGMGHGWAGGEGTYGGGASYESATRLVWDFFAEQSR